MDAANRRAMSVDAPALCLHELGFSYPAAEGAVAPQVLRGVELCVPSGAFALLVGGTGSGKTTLLRLAKPEIAPVGERQGGVRVFGREVRDLSLAESAQLVGYVFQSPESQIVCDTVWHELVFGLENLGLSQQEMRRRLSEVCVFLGIEGWLRRRCAELSGGERQVVSLAAVLAMRPRLLLLDEPTAMLDPVAEQGFLSLLFRANRELGITVVVATHGPVPMLPYATCAFRLEGGEVHEAVPAGLSVRPELGRPLPQAGPARQVLMARDLWVRYGRDEAWVLRGCDLELHAGEVRALVGGNGCGKSTLLAVVAGVRKPRHGRLKLAAGLRRALLPQAPKALLGCETVREELLEWADEGGYGESEVDEALARLALAADADRHPYDLSGGQQQLLALEKLLLMQPELLLLDEPTKGLDADARRQVAERVRTLATAGAAVLVATHDLAFVEASCHAVSLLFDGQVGEPEATDAFFASSWMWKP